MRIASLIIGLFMSAWVFFEGFIVSTLFNIGNDEDMASTAAGGVIAGIVGVLASALVIAFPLASVFLFGFAGGISFIVAAGGYGNHWVWGSLYVLLAAMSFFGWRGKKRDRREKVSEAARQKERDDQIYELLQQQRRAELSKITCPSCGHQNVTGTRFCSNCGAPVFGVASPSPSNTI